MRPHRLHYCIMYSYIEYIIKDAHMLYYGLTLVLLCQKDCWRLVRPHRVPVCSASSASAAHAPNPRAPQTYGSSTRLAALDHAFRTFRPATRFSNFFSFFPALSFPYRPNTHLFIFAVGCHEMCHSLNTVLWMAHSNKLSSFLILTLLFYTWKDWGS